MPVTIDATVWETSVDAGSYLKGRAIQGGEKAQPAIDFSPLFGRFPRVFWEESSTRGGHLFKPLALQSAYYGPARFFGPSKRFVKTHALQ
jgi:hypothetical protein